ncbi:porin [Sphaerotilus montanus]|uniref:porin n=1 Tax=Sphaerotilus montanus TaxID=522889 RepID=UPI003FA33B8F
MKKSLLALAVLGAFAGAASAQSSVTLYGKVDLGVGKATGSADKQVRDGASSRVGIKGVEDLGGGMKALFGFEHRFSPDTGMDTTTEGKTPTSTFWNGYSTVGLGGTFGTVNLGRQYTSAFTLAQDVFDPFGGYTVAGLRGVALTPKTKVLVDNVQTPTDAAKLRTANSIRYDGTFGGVSVAADIAERSTSAASGAKRPYSVAAQYALGPVLAAVSYENPEGAKDNLLTAGVAYTFGPAKLAAALSSGKDADGDKLRGYLLGATVKVGTAGRVLAGYASLKEDSGTTSATAKKVSLGYRHDLSKRTFLYTDVTRVNKVINSTEQTGYDFGVQHNF